MVLYNLLQVYVTMYLNDCQRTAFYEGIGLNTKEFDMHVIIEVKMSCLFLTVPSSLQFSCHLLCFR
jgi:magnesium-protoporphyrin IX monomethyl ester (oxidative) cyclase